GIGEVAVSPVDDDVAFIEERQKLLDDGIHRRAGFHEHHHPARLFELRDELLERPGAYDTRIFRRSSHELLHDGGRPVIYGHGKSVVTHVEHEVLPHDGEAYKGNVGLWFRHVQSILMIMVSAERIEHRSHPPQIMDTLI